MDTTALDSVPTPVHDDHAGLRRALVMSAQARPDLMSSAVVRVNLAAQHAPGLGLDPHHVIGWALLHEIELMRRAPAPEPLRIAVCDLPPDLYVSAGAHTMAGEMPKDLPMPPPALALALIAWCQLVVMPGARQVSLHQRRLYTERHYATWHEQYHAWQRLLALAELVERRARPVRSRP